ncbi:C45 family autoproteolytic acyltransferase/hydolase [Haloglycomyces albus]|uniref:C45 family autoproteolytic acyltransferase/hydolase n=1 Tax=Haloglycomyces albus TaxID=526067 RepID=UPI00146FBF92|nr:C45 family peptidase [Haloglycomyces albus]
MTQIPVIEVSGSPYERGLTQGDVFGADVAANAREYRSRIRVAGLSDAEIKRRSRDFITRCGDFDPDYLAMMEGVSRGSGTELEDVAMSNARYELLYTTWSEFGRPTIASVKGECTSVGATSPGFTDGAVRIAQNWDWFPQIKGGWLRYREGGVNVLGFTEAGIVGPKIGLNSAGIGVCLMGMGSSDDTWQVAGMPVHMRTWKVLSSTTLAEALATVSLPRPGCSANFLIGSRDEGVINVETSPHGTVTTHQNGSDPLIHANHFLSPEALGVDQSWLASGRQSTFVRQERMETLLGTGPLDEKDVESALRDHENAELSLCRHVVEEEPPELWSSTAMAVHMNLSEGHLRYTWGPPCESEFEQLHVSE